MALARKGVSSTTVWTRGPATSPSILFRTATIVSQFGIIFRKVASCVPDQN